MHSADVHPNEVAFTGRESASYIEERHVVRRDDEEEGQEEFIRSHECGEEKRIQKAKLGKLTLVVNHNRLYSLVLSFFINPIGASVGGLGSYCHGSWALSRDHGRPLPSTLDTVVLYKLGKSAIVTTAT